MVPSARMKCENGLFSRGNDTITTLLFTICEL